ncbi:hypothetical protein [Streptomyces sp. NPDC020667]|uniref:hypothetical protein n=1 Tax=Streptomyces sp. NPDC020667 TaxID=3154895 RepID=UPI0033FEBC1B
MDVPPDSPVPTPNSGQEPSAPPSDEREAFRRTAGRQSDERAELAFLASKVHVARTHPTLSLAERQASLAELADRLGEGALGLRDRADGPTPGGVGYGVFYTTPFKTGFAQGTSLYWEVICPTSPGGNVDTWLYLTAMNRAGKGLEAFVSYHAQDAPRFKVFDWARDDHWQIDIPWSSLGAYLMTRSAHGQNYQVLGIWNSTWQLSPGSWRNQALLWNQAAQRYDLIYQYDYAAALADQTGGWIGSWAPIVETFQPSYSHTNRFGALRTMLITRDSGGTWGSWQLLSSADSYIRTDNTGFRTVFLDPDYAFAVES